MRLTFLQAVWVRVQVEWIRLHNWLRGHGYVHGGYVLSGDGTKKINVETGDITPVPIAFEQTIDKIVDEMANAPHTFTAGDVGKPISGGGLVPGTVVESVTVLQESPWNISVDVIVCSPGGFLHKLGIENHDSPYIVGVPEHGHQVPAFIAGGEHVLAKKHAAMVAAHNAGVISHETLVSHFGGAEPEIREDKRWFNPLTHSFETKPAAPPALLPRNKRKLRL